MACVVITEHENKLSHFRSPGTRRVFYIKMTNLINQPSLKLHNAIVSLLDDNGITYQHLVHEPTPTCLDAARIRGTSLEQGAKALLFFADKKPVLAVLSSARKLDNKAFKKEFKIKDLRMASVDEVREFTSVIPGAVPPFGNIFHVPVYADKNLFANNQIAFNAGSQSYSIIMKSSDFINLVNPIMGQFAL